MLHSTLIYHKSPRSPGVYRCISVPGISLVIPTPVTILAVDSISVARSLSDTPTLALTLALTLTLTLGQRVGLSLSRRRCGARYQRRTLQRWHIQTQQD